jgi:signal transduction histidine kinase
MAGWTPSVYPSDAEALATAQATRRARRIGIVGAAMLLIVVGAILSARLVGRELDLARMKTQFAANVSHELRSPITQIRLKAESLQLGLARDEEKRQQHYDAIVRESERLSRLVDNVLDFSSIERGTKQYSYVPTDMADVVRQCVDSMRFSIIARGLQIEMDIDDDVPIILASPEAIGQAMTNLLSNAAKYGASGDSVIVRVRGVENGVTVDVQDRGLGIVEEEIPHIFEQYYRSRNPNALRLKGTGIGLAIVKYIMEAHGGHVEVTSDLGKGSTFSLCFPLTPPDPTGAA